MRYMALALSFVLLFNSPAMAEKRADISLEEAVRIVSKNVAGTVMDAEFEDGVYEVKIRTERGDRIKLKIDPRDGRVLRKARIIKSDKH